MFAFLVVRLLSLLIGNLRKELRSLITFAEKYVVPSFTEPPTLVPLSFASDVLNEGEFAQLICFVRTGDEPLTLSWALKGAKISSEPGLTTSSLGTRTSMLTISSVGYRHSGTYTCTAKNNAGSTSQSAELKVNGK